MQSMAVPAKSGQNQSQSGLDLITPEWREHCLHAAKLFGLGYSRKDVAKVMAKLLYEDRDWPPDAKLTSARDRVRSWCQKQWFRDLIWDNAVVELDLQTPQILRGVAGKAKKGRVDAAKLALAVTGRHNDKDQAVPAAVTINIANIPRPARQDVEGSHDEIGIVVDED